MIRNLVDDIKEKVEDTDKIDSDTFKPTNKQLGYGCWGSVRLYNDSAGQKWAIKTFNPNNTAQKQMKERGWNKEDVMRREAIPLDSAHHHIVPRIIEKRKKKYSKPDFLKELWRLCGSFS